MTTPAETSIIQPLPLGSNPTLRRRFMVVDEQIPGNFRFGLFLEVLDKLAEETALAYVRRSFPEARVVTAAIDHIFIRNGADVNRDLLLHARINYVGRSSLEVGIRVEHPGEPLVHIASCYFTMVARSGAGPDATSVALSPLDYSTELEQVRREKALASREEYKQTQEALLEPPTREEYEMLTGLHLAQEERGFNGLVAGRLVTESWERMYPEQENVPQTIFGGYLVRRAYEVSAICAELVAPDRPVIVAVNRINFFHPVRLDDKLHFTSRVVYTGRTSVCVEAGIQRISRDRTTSALSNSCLFTFVNVDRQMRPQPVPAIYPSTYAEDARYLAGSRQHEGYRKLKEQGKFHH